MRLGGAVMAIVKSGQRRNTKYKQTYFDKWKLFTLYNVC